MTAPSDIDAVGLLAAHARFRAIDIDVIGFLERDGVFGSTDVDGVADAANGDVVPDSLDRDLVPVAMNIAGCAHA